MSVSIKKQIGSVMVVVGTEVGAGILALPILTAKLGFFLSMIVMLVAWLVMLYTALIVADINLKMPEESSFGKMATTFLGPWGTVVSWGSFLLLLYAISVAYVSAASSVFHVLVPQISQNKMALMLVCVTAFLVLQGVKSIDLVNRFLFLIMTISFFCTCYIFLQYVHLENLFDMNATTGIFVLAFPVIITSFTSHLMIPTLNTYLESDARVLFRVIFLGSLIPLVLYILWLISVLGAIPLQGDGSFMNDIFAKKAVTAANIGDVLLLLKKKVDMNFAFISIESFSTFAILTSYLGVSMSLYHFIEDSFSLKKMKNVWQQKGIGTALTFIIPLAIVIFDPDLFIRALGYVGTCVVILLVILPVLMLRKLEQQNQQMNYKISSWKWARVISMLLGVSVIFFEIINNFALLPV